MTKERIRDWLEAADFNGRGCQHSYLTIALAVGCSETHAIRCVRELEDAGDVEIDRAPRGSKRPNTYRVRGRNPRLRVPVLLRLAEVRKLRRELCQSKENGSPSRDKPPGKDSRSNVVNQRCGREKTGNLVRREARTRFERSRGVPEPARALRIVGCPDCERKDRMLAAMELDLANLEADLKAKRRQIKDLLTDKDEKRRQDPDYSLAVRLAEFWVEQTGRDAARTELGMARVGAVLARLKGRKRLGSENPARDVAKAILGAKVDAWVDRKGKRHDELKLICRDEATLEDFIERYERRKARSSR